ncbi:MAG: DUF3313 domain-containing protein, partial [Paraburkholderia sp.]
RPNSQDDSGRVPYRFAPQTEWQKYTKLIIDPVTIYQGADNQFGDMQDADKAALASYMQTEFAEKLRTRFEPATQAGAGTLRLKLILTGAKTSTPVLSTFSRFDIAGSLYNVTQTVRGKEGAFTGSVIYAVEIYDSSSNRLLSAYVTKQYPNPYNIGASFGSLSASKTGIEKGADALVAQFK